MFVGARRHDYARGCLQFRGRSAQDVPVGLVLQYSPFENSSMFWCKMSFVDHEKGNLGFRLLWHLMHLVFSLCYFVHSLINAIESFLISSGIFKQYKHLDISKVQYLAVVIDSEEALEMLKVVELLRWLADIGIKKICLYDKEGVLKKSKDALMIWLKSERILKEGTSYPVLEQKYMSLEVISFSDSKDAVAKAANFLLMKHYLGTEETPELTEPDMTNALKAIGMVWDSRARSHVNLWACEMPPRISSLEKSLHRDGVSITPLSCGFKELLDNFVINPNQHMGPLKSMKFGAIIKAIHKFTKVHQNYGTSARFIYAVDFLLSLLVLISYLATNLILNQSMFLV
ncbi:Nogo-B receptor [Striga asiatica]|uniref:ditrans,polycis-polyprenyl diphosphate synthase [(2E,6E)-farnesyldiphosphate specific] n=1 Tax=Striga asiatica TaxID=4170 RepID=A0A5A7R7Z7_STRAF|nr:Nogo-B receptor [Striga asiatica]